MDIRTINLPIPLELILDLTEDQFYELCQKNQDLKFERNCSGVLTIMSPTGGETSHRNFNIAVELGIWNKQTKLGIAFDSSGGFKLPNGADRSPDVSWIRSDRWFSLTPQQRERFVPLCPDFVVELRSSSDSLKSLQDKMNEYRENGAKLGWLIDTKHKRVEIYRPQQEFEILENPTTLSGEDILPGFLLDLTLIW
ncbi:Uma2 family endonuclease [Planktothrix mougeotii]|uniref:Uma2 family endonuclease n=1 Tax=Planktothrix mougeotii LEGE 06226 TaxID=1828728 RepID=A0ABR9UFH2_9CYAN|nr:Uma2 family endonuclease [Planktothrix mougeotii]MBE9145215.1 Uma2 family endonuclease [Planktothrix mougeotii LEGE 06226]